MTAAPLFGNIPAILEKENTGKKEVKIIPV
jgi:hypothetical protein